MKLVLMAGDIRLKEEQVGVAGDVYIFGKTTKKNQHKNVDSDNLLLFLDAAVATPGHFSKVSPAMVKKFLICVQVNIRLYQLKFEYCQYISKY